LHGLVASCGQSTEIESSCGNKGTVSLFLDTKAYGCGPAKSTTATKNLLSDASTGGAFHRVAGKEEQSRSALVKVLQQLEQASVQHDTWAQDHGQDKVSNVHDIENMVDRFNELNSFREVTLSPDSQARGGFRDMPWLVTSPPRSPGTDLLSRTSSSIHPWSPEEIEQHRMRLYETEEWRLARDCMVECLQTHESSIHLVTTEQEAYASSKIEFLQAAATLEQQGQLSKKEWKHALACSEEHLSQLEVLTITLSEECSQSEAKLNKSEQEVQDITQAKDSLQVARDKCAVQLEESASKLLKALNFEKQVEE